MVEWNLLQYISQRIINYLVLRYWLKKMMREEGYLIFVFGPIFRFHFIDYYHSELPEVTTSYNQRKTQECSEFLQHEIGVVSLWSIQVKRHENLNADFYCCNYFYLVINTSQRPIFCWCGGILEPDN
jgi:hypothetical protein